MFKSGFISNYTLWYYIYGTWCTSLILKIPVFKAILDYYLFAFCSISFSIWNSSDICKTFSFNQLSYFPSLYLLCIFWVISSDLSFSSLILSSTISTYSPIVLLGFHSFFFFFSIFRIHPLSKSSHLQIVLFLVHVTIPFLMS